MSKRILIIIPVLNEVGNVLNITLKLKKYLKKNYDLLFIDDNSSDGTIEKIKSIQKKNKNVFLFIRPKKLGIGSAHKKGISWGFKNRYRLIVTMDCDGTHNPIHIPRMINLIDKKGFDLVSTNRFLKKDSLSDWSLWRKYLTTLRHYVIKILLNVNYDSSGAYRCYNTKKIKLKDITNAKDDSYSFFWESIFLLSKKNYKITEISIKLPGRLSGSSKMRFKDIFSAIIYLLKISFKNIFI